MALQIRGSSQIKSGINLSKLDNQGGTIAGDVTLSGDAVTINNTLTTKGSTTLGDATSDTTTCSGTLNANAIENTPIGDSNSSTGSFTTISSSGVSTLNSLAVTNNTSVGGNLTVDGNLTVSGDTVQMDVSTLKIEDSLLQLSKGNLSNLLDIGFFAKTETGVENSDLNPIDYPSLMSPVSSADVGYYFYQKKIAFGEVTAISGNGKVLASHWKNTYDDDYRIYIYDWDDSDGWVYRNYLQWGGDTASATNPGDQLFDISFDYTGDLLIFSINLYWSAGTTPVDWSEEGCRVHRYEWKDTDNDNVKDSWVSDGYFIPPSEFNEIKSICVRKKSNGDIIYILCMPDYPYSGYNTSNSNKGLVQTYIKYSNTTDTNSVDEMYINSSTGQVELPSDSRFTCVDSADIEGDNGGENFGSGGVSLNSDGTKLAVGNYYGPSGATYVTPPGNSGYVKIYNWNSVDETWELEDTIQDPNSANGNYFGNNPCFDGDGLKIAISENFEEYVDSNDLHYTGRVHFFKYNSTSEEWESDSDNYPDIVGEKYSRSYAHSITSDFSKIIVGAPFDYRYYSYRNNSNGEKWSDYNDHSNGSKLIDGIVRTYIHDNSSWNEVYDSGYLVDKFSGLIRDADDSGKFKFFTTQLDISSSSTVTFTGSTTDTLLATIEGNVTGNLTGNVTGNSSTMSKLQTPRTISLGTDLSGSVSFDGSSNVTLNATIVDGSIQLSNIDFFVDEDDLGGLSSSDVKVPSQQSVKKYVDDRVSDGGYTELETKDIKMVNSDGDFVKTKKIFQTSLIGSSDITNGYVSLSTNVETQFEHLSSVFLNGIKLRFGTSTQVLNSQRDYYFDDTTKNKIYFSSDIITQNDKLEIRYFVLS